MKESKQVNLLESSRQAIDSSLQIIERIGNRLPDPITLFALLCIIVVVMSAIAGNAGLSVTHPVTGETINAISLLAPDGIRRIVTEAVTNFATFPPLGTVLVVILGVGTAEQTGLLSAGLRQGISIVPARLMTPAIVFLGIMSNIASDAGYLVLPPLGAFIFGAVGRHPLAGLTAAFAGIAGGFNANLLIGTLDPVLAGLTQSSAGFIDPNYTVNATANYYFMAVSTLLITAIGWLVTDWIVEPRLGTYPFPAQRSKTSNHDFDTLTPAEEQGLRWATYAVIVIFGLLAVLVIPSHGILRQPETYTLIPSPLLTGIVPIIMVTFLVPGIMYGLGAGTIKTDKDVIQKMTLAMSGMGYYVVLSFFAAQFIAYFGWTNLGLIFAVSGAALLQTIGITGLPLVFSFMGVSSITNLFIGSASAKWAVMAPVFVPMLMLLNYSPEFTQLIYRMGDSTTNLITPLMPYFPIIVAFGRKYDSKFGIGTLVAIMIPYCLSFGFTWSLFLVLWLLLELPLGPGASTYLNLPT